MPSVHLNDRVRVGKEVYEEYQIQGEKSAQESQLKEMYKLERNKREEEISDQRRREER